MALRLLGLAITDQFAGAAADRYGEAQNAFDLLADPYERSYYSGLLHERRAKAQMQVGRPLTSVRVGFETAMRCFEEAEKIRPAGNDDAILRWNRCARLLQKLPHKGEAEMHELEIHDSPPVPTCARTMRGK